MLSLKLSFETMVSLSLRFTSQLCICTPRIVLCHQINHHCSWLSQRNPRKNLHCFVKRIGQNGVAASSVSNDYPLSGLDDVLMGYIFGKKKATEVAHLVWKRIVHKGDTVIDATCGNGFDTLAMLKLVADESGRGCVCGLDIQKDALENTTSLLNESLDPNEKELVKLFPICHSRMDELVPDGSLVRLVAFNLGYLPGGDKAITTTSGTTILALEAAKRILAPGGCKKDISTQRAYQHSSLYRASWRKGGI